MIALSGIATRKAILLIDLKKTKVEGRQMIHSLIEAGALRTRPVLPTSCSAMLATWAIMPDPIFSELA